MSALEVVRQREREDMEIGFRAGEAYRLSRAVEIRHEPEPVAFRPGTRLLVVVL